MQKITLDFVLETIKERHALKSDYQVCKLIDTSTSLMSGWRAGRSHPDEKYCQRLAEAAGIDPLVLAASMQAQRSKTEEARSLWAMVAERLQMVPQALAAAVFAVLFATSFVAGDAHAASASDTPAAKSADSISYTSYLSDFLARCAAWWAWIQSQFSSLPAHQHAQYGPQIAAVF